MYLIQYLGTFSVEHIKENLTVTHLHTSTREHTH